MMKIYAFLIVMIAALPLLLFLSMSSMGHGHMHMCPISMLMGADCIGGDVGTIEHMSYHITAAQDVAPGILLSEIMIAVPLLLLFFTIFPQKRVALTAARMLISRVRKRSRNASFFALRKQFKWIAHVRHDNEWFVLPAGASLIVT